MAPKDDENLVLEKVNAWFFMMDYLKLLTTQNVHQTESLSAF